MKRFSPLVAVAALLAVFAVAPAPAGAATPQEDRLRQPVYGTEIHGDQFRNFADPSVLRVGRTYYAYSTNQSGGFLRRIMVMASPNLWDWNAPATAPREALGRTPNWARSLSAGGSFWAPSVVRAGGRYVMYFAAKHRAVSSDRPGWCIGVATASAPQGPFAPRDTPLFCRVNSSGATPASLSSSPGTDRGAIDPQVFRAPNGTLYLYFKALDNLYQIWGVQLSNTGRSTVGAARGLVPMNSQTQSWEYSQRLHFTVLENPAMTYNPTPGVTRRFLLLYAGGEWQTPSNYGTGYATCATPLSGCLRQTTGRPWLRTRGESAGPGGASTFAGPGGIPWIAYHTYRAGHTMDGWGRRLHVEPLGFSRGAPRLADRRPTGTIVATTPAPGTVHLVGTADDPDTGRPVNLSIREAGIQIATATTGSSRNWAIADRTGVSPGAHRYCAVATDDNGLSPRVIGCAEITVS